MICSSCGAELRDGDAYCPMCGSKIEIVSQEKESIYDQILRQQINDAKQEDGSQTGTGLPTGNESAEESDVSKEEANENMPKRTPADWWDGWICSNCGKKNNINQKTCLGCHLDIRSSISLGRRSGTVSQEEEQFYYERILPQQMQMELLQKQNDEFMREKKVRMSQEESYRQTGDQHDTVSGLAVCSLVVGIFAIYASFSLSVFRQPIVLAVISLLAMLFSISPIRNKRKGMGMAIAGLVCGLIAFARVVMIWSTLTNGYQFMFD